MKKNYSLWLSTLFLSQAFAMPLPSQELKSYECDACRYLPHQKLMSSWPITKPIAKAEVLHQQSSKKYRLTVNYAELHQGITLHTLAPGAVIRIVPEHKRGHESFFITPQQGKPLSLQEASSLFTEHDSVNDTLFSNEPQWMLQLKPELGQGSFLLTANSLNAKADDKFSIHVFDKASSGMLFIQTDKSHYQYGDELLVNIQFSNNGAALPIDKIQANVYSPDGLTYDLNLIPSGANAYQGKLRLYSDKNPAGGNWYVEVETSTQVGNQVIRREAHTAFSYAIPSAAISDIHEENNLRFRATVKAATASRYALQAILVAHDSKGKPVAVGVAQAAKWLNPGESTLHIDFEKINLDKFKPPFYLNEIRLLDYGQMKPVFEYNAPIAIQKITG